MSKESRSRKGFTIIELLIVLAILAVLIAVVIVVTIPFLADRAERTRRSECEERLLSCRRVLQYELMATNNQVSTERFRELMRESMFTKDGDSCSVKGLCGSGGYYIYDETAHTIRCSKHEMTQAEVITSDPDYIKKMVKTEEFRKFFASHRTDGVIDSREEDTGAPLKERLKKKLRHILCDEDDFDFQICRTSDKESVNGGAPSGEESPAAAEVSAADGTYTILVSGPISHLNSGSLIKATGFKVIIKGGLIAVGKPGELAVITVSDEDEGYLYLKSEEYDWNMVEEPVLP